MNKILRWLAYALVAISAVLIIWSLIGTCRHHRCSHEMMKKETISMRHHTKAECDSVKKDTTHCMKGKMEKYDSIECKHHEMGEHMEMMPPCSCMNPSGNLMNIAGKLLLLAIALLIISGKCSCCCESDKKEG